MIVKTAQAVLVQPGDLMKIVSDAFLAGASKNGVQWTGKLALGDEQRWHAYRHNIGATFERVDRALHAEMARAGTVPDPMPKVKALEWCDPQKPDGKESFHDWCEAASPLGAYMIEWKSWKGPDDGHVVESIHGFVGCGYSLEEAKAIAQADFERRILSALEGNDDAGFFRKEPTHG